MTCSRCQQAKDPMDKPPFRGTMGQTIQQNVCHDCWTEWIAMQTKIINEYRLSLGDPRGQQLLDQQMRVFLNLGEPGDTPGGGAAPVGTPRDPG
jgi:Fe-S cluster biosynthesis and repair protein YggX